MRRLFSEARVLLLVLGCLLPLTAVADAFAGGLYKGHGRRSGRHGPGSAHYSDHPFAARLNFGGGFHGAIDNLYDSLPYTRGGFFDGGYGVTGLRDSDRFLEFGGYAQAGIEMHVGNGVTLEPYAMYRSLEDRNRFFVNDVGGRFNVSTFRDIEAFSGGLTLRKYVTGRSGWAYWGLGGGFVRSDAIVSEFVDGVGTFSFDGIDESPEVHFVVGFDTKVGESMALGLELGYRHTWLDEPSDFDGLILGARMGLLIP